MVHTISSKSKASMGFVVELYDRATYIEEEANVCLHFEEVVNSPDLTLPNGLPPILSATHFPFGDYISLPIGGHNDDDLETLQCFPSLRCLLAGDEAVTDRGVRYLRELRDLTFLDLAGTSLTNRGLHHLRSLCKLQQIDVSYTRVTGAGLSLLADLPNLRILQASHLEITDFVLDGGFPSLEAVVFSHEKPGRICIKDLPQLRIVNCNDGDLAEEILVENLPLLKVLALPRCDNITITNTPVKKVKEDNRIIYTAEY